MPIRVTCCHLFHKFLLCGKEAQWTWAKLKYFNPVPLVASTIEQVGVAKYFTKHDPRNACHLIRFRVVDEWNTAFITNTGHYQGMPYGSSMGLLVFQAFINEILQEILHICIITYTDDILIKLLKQKKRYMQCCKSS